MGFRGTRSPAHSSTMQCYDPTKRLRRRRRLLDDHPLADHGTARIAAAGEIPGLDPISGTATSGDQVFLTPRD